MIIGQGITDGVLGEKSDRCFRGRALNTSVRLSSSLLDRFNGGVRILQ